MTSQGTSLVAKRPLLAVLYQAIDPPLIDGARKPKKPGGYQDSGADIAFVLQSQTQSNVVTPIHCPDASKNTGWCFPDNEAGILDAIRSGATHLWANTIVFASHPLQASSRLDEHQKAVRIIGQPPLLVEKYDDKAYTNDLLRARGSFTMPRGWTIDLNADRKSFFLEQKLHFPIVGKPIRGRGSQGVKVCHSFEELHDHFDVLSKDSPVAMLEEYLPGEEATVTVMPPSKQRPEYWAMPIVVRFNHEDGVAPYNGIVAVTKNSKALTLEESEKDGRYQQAAEECVEVAKLLCATAPIRIDIRRVTQDPGAQFALFDINMKPNMTGPGRPGRDDQSSLTALSGAALGWTYADLLQQILGSACSLGELRNIRPELT